MRLLISVPIGRATFEEMDTAAEWRAAIHDGVLRRDTLVTAYRNDEPGVSMPAGSVEELAELFDEVLGAAPAKGSRRGAARSGRSTEERSGSDLVARPDEKGSSAEVPVSEDVNESEAASAPVEQQQVSQDATVTTDSPPKSGGSGLATPPPLYGSASTKVKTRPEAPRPKASQPSGSRPDAVRAVKGSSTGQTGDRSQKSTLERLLNSPIAWTIFIIVLLIVAVSNCSTDGGSPEPARDPGDVASMYVGRVINVRQSPSRSAAMMGRLLRGDRLEGAWRQSEGETWFEITSGPHAGGFVWGGNLLSQAPPSLQGGPSVEQLLQAADMRAEPNYGGHIMTRLSEGESIEVLGWTLDGWAEVAIEGLGIGYVHTSAFQPSAEDALAEATVEETADAADCRTQTYSEDGVTFEQEYCRVDGVWTAAGRAAVVRRAPEPPVPTPPQPARPASPVQSQPPLPDQPETQPPPPTQPRAAAPALISRPNWTRRPGFDDFNRVIPGAALDAGQQGSAGLSCRVTGQGALDNCSITSETPAGWGFGRAALRLAPSFRMSGRDLDGHPTAGRTVQFTITFAFEDE